MDPEEIAGSIPSDEPFSYIVLSASPKLSHQSYVADTADELALFQQLYHWVKRNVPNDLTGYSFQNTSIGDVGSFGDLLIDLTGYI